MMESSKPTASARASEASEAAIWDAYNTLLMGPDIERLRKMLARAELFQMTLDVPGDIVECGVFKGAGLMFWLKLLRIHAPGALKRVVGFDMFDAFRGASNEAESKAVSHFVTESAFRGVATESIYELAAAAGAPRSQCELVAGDISETAKAYAEANPGFRISLLHLDLDLEAPTYAALQAFWPRVVPGGVVVFDEYAARQWTESGAVDQFFKEAGAKPRLRSLPWARTPTAFVVKEWG